MINKIDLLTPPCNTGPNKFENTANYSAKRIEQLEQKLRNELSINSDSKELTQHKSTIKRLEQANSLLKGATPENFDDHYFYRHTKNI